MTNDFAALASELLASFGFADRRTPAPHFINMELTFKGGALLAYGSYAAPEYGGSGVCIQMYSVDDEYINLCDTENLDELRDTASAAVDFMKLIDQLSEKYPKPAEEE